jgi:hypothetical protein
MKKLLVALAFLLTACIYPVYAQPKVLAALIPSDGEEHLLVTIYERNCEPTGWNATLTNTDSVTRGCWYQDGDLIKVKVPNAEGIKTFPYSEFKLIGYVRTQSITKQEEKKQLLTNLTCAADAWAGDIVVERNLDGSLKSLVVSGESVTATEKSNSLNFSFKGLNISLSTLTGAFNYETSGFQTLLNNNLFGGKNTKGTGYCKVNTGAKKF